MAWHHIDDPNSQELDELAKRYNLHPLHIEDCRHGKQRAKLEERPDYMFVVLKPVTVTDNAELNFSDLDVFVGHDYAITVAEERCKPVSDAIANVRRNGEEPRPDQVLYRVFDSIVDSYLVAIDCIGDRIDDLEDVVIDHPTPEVLQEVFRLKRTIMNLRRVMVNTRDIGLYLNRYTGNFISPDMAPYFRDIYDHIARNLDSTETQRDLLNGTLDVYLSSVSNRTNNVMKVLTVLSTIALPAIVISGIYGMNVKAIPFADTPHGVWVVLALMLATTLGLLGLLRKFGWF